MRLLQQFRNQLVAVLDWHAVEKGLIPVVALLPICLSYVFWASQTLARPDRARLVNVDVLLQLQFHLQVIVAGAVALTLLGLWLRRRWPDLIAFEYAGVIYYASAMAYCGYVTGSTSFAAGIVVLGAPLFGFILLDREPVLAGLAVALGSLVYATYASAAGQLPYAPLIVPPVDLDSRLYWANSMYIMALPHLLIILPLADRALTLWREREATIRVLSRTDMLTGIHNRRSIIELLEKEVARTLRHGPPLAVVLLDLDFFKKVNDTWGHPTGDRVLKAAATALAGSIRQCDALGRYGGEEFMLLLPDTPLEGAKVLAERCRQRLSEVTVTADNGETFTISGSFGLASNEMLAQFSGDMLIKAADDALYQAKHKGRNRVEVAVTPDAG